MRMIVAPRRPHRADGHRRSRRRHARRSERGAPITLDVGARRAISCCAGRSEIIGATTTDVDEVQATMEGKDVATGPSADDRRRTCRRAASVDARS